MNSTLSPKCYVDLPSSLAGLALTSCLLFFSLFLFISRRKSRKWLVRCRDVPMVSGAGLALFFPVIASVLPDLVPSNASSLSGVKVFGRVCAFTSPLAFSTLIAARILLLFYRVCIASERITSRDRDRTTSSQGLTLYRRYVNLKNRIRKIATIAVVIEILFGIVYFSYTVDFYCSDGNSAVGCCDDWWIQDFAFVTSLAVSAAMLFACALRLYSLRSSSALPAHAFAELRAVLLVSSIGLVLGFLFRAGFLDGNSVVTRIVIAHGTVWILALVMLLYPALRTLESLHTTNNAVRIGVRLPSSPVVQSTPLSLPEDQRFELDEILLDDAGIDAFERHLAKEFSTESLHFWSVRML